jgi:peptide/nickel transport system substrate-binding protein
MKSVLLKKAVGVGVGAVAAMALAATASAQTPKSGGILEFVVPGGIPSFDGHRETTYAMIHPIRPFYSLLIRVDPDNPSSPDFVCDLCEGDVPDGGADGTEYVFKLKQGVKFHDGTPLTSADVKATYDKIVFPPEGVSSARKAQYEQVESISTPDDHTIVFKLKYPSGAFIPAMASPFNFVYAKKDIDANGYDWHQKNVNGTGPFVFEEYQAGAFVRGKKYADYHFPGRPYLDGFRATQSAKLAVSVAAIRGDRAAIEFRGFPPKSRDDLVSALGDQITVQESDWNCVLLATPNQKVKPFDDPRVRQALTLAVDRWGGSKYLSRIAIVKTVGGVAYPNHPLAATEEELTQLRGYWKDLDKSRAEAKRLLADAGQSNLSFTLNNRGVDQPYKIVGTWLLDQWKKVGLDVTQRVQPTAPFYDTIRSKKDFDVTVEFNCQSVVNPLADVAKFRGSAGDNYGQYEDAKLDELFDKMNRARDPKEQRATMREYERIAIDEQAHIGVTLWWYKINPHRSYVKGWKISPSHYLNQHLDNVWLDK